MILVKIIKALVNNHFDFDNKKNPRQHDPSCFSKMTDCTKKYKI